MNDAANAALFAGIEQGSHSRCVDTLYIFSPAVLKNTSAIDDRFNAIENRKPLLRAAGSCNV
jgi:hypothetical protein